ncbi:rlmJ [Symbiodinium sp. CCMP2456]|nr:rlmJ [Symbiodinium sp. CCMP2456]
MKGCCTSQINLRQWGRLGLILCVTYKYILVSWEQGFRKASRTYARCPSWRGICIIAAVWLPVQQQPQLQLPPRAFQAVSGTPKSSKIASLSIPHVSSPPVAPPELEAPGFKEVSAPPPPLQEPSLPLEQEDHLPSVGSVGHAEGTCRPCAFVFKKGCDSGSQCTFCHLCPPGEKKRRMKEKSTKKATEAHLPPPCTRKL